MLIPGDYSTPNSLDWVLLCIYTPKSHWTECRCVERYKTVYNVDSVITFDISTVVITYQLLQAGMYIGLLIDIDDHIYALFFEAISTHSSRNLWTGYILLCIHTQSHIAQKVDKFKGTQDFRLTQLRVGQS